MDGAGSNELFHGVSAPTSGDARERERERESEREEKEKKKKKKMDGAGSNELFHGVSAPTLGTEVPTATDINIPPEENVISSSENVASGSGSGSGSASSNSSVAREQDLCMPFANIIRIMRTVLPADAKISDDAKQSMQDCVSEFISFITSEANKRCHRELRKTVTAEDLLWAMSSLGFDNYIEPLTMYLRGYRALNGSPRGSFRGLPLPPPRRTTPAVDAAAAASTAAPATSAAAPLPQFHMPAAAPPMPPFSVYGAGYNVDMHGRRDEFGGSSSSEAPPMNQSFYPRPPFN